MLIRWMGLANIALALLGAGLTLRAVVHLSRSGTVPTSFPYYRAALISMALLNSVWFYLCATAGVRLWKRDIRGYIASKRLFGFEVVYFLVVLGLAPVSAIVALSMLAQWLPLYYSMLGLILLSIVIRRKHFTSDSGNALPLMS